MKTKFQLSSIKHRAVLFVSILMITISIIASIIIFQSMANSLIEHYEADKKAKVESMSIALAQSMKLYDYNEVEHLITNELSFEHIEYIAVFGKNGTLVRSATFKDVQKENLEFVSTNIESNGENIGTVEIGFSKQYIYDMVNSSVRPLIFGWLLMIFILAFVIYSWTNTIIIKPLNYLSKETKKISEGDLSVHTKLQRNDEIGILSNNFNQMAENLAASYGKLKHLNLTLRAMRNINQLITKERDPGKLIKKICGTLTKNYGYPLVGISLFNKSGKIAKIAASGSNKMLQKMIKMMKQEKFPDCVKKSLQQKEPVVIENPASTCDNCLLKNLCKGTGIVVVQLSHREKLYGIIYVRLSHEFIKNDEEISLFKEVADDISFGLYRIELEEKDKALLKKEIEQHRQVKTFAKMMLALTSKTALNDVFDEILKQANYLVPYNASNIALIKGNALYNVCWKGYKKYGMEELMANTIQPLDKYKIPGIAIKEKKILIIPDTAKEPDWVILKETAWIKSHIAVPIILQNRVLGMLRIDSEIPNKFSNKDAKKLESLANAAAIAIEKARLLEKTRKEVKQREKAEKNVKESYKNLQKTMQGTIFTLAKIVEMKDPYTAGHQRKVAQLSEIIAKEMKLSKERIETLKTAALLHDIGKIKIPSEILTKPTKLLPIEFSLIKEHPLNGYEILKNIEFPGPVTKIVLQHHERMDGSGYPNGLKGNEIMLEARILAVADVVEAMSSHRPYRPALGIDKALEEIEKNKGILYDSKVANVCVKLFKEKGFKFEE